MLHLIRWDQKALNWQQWLTFRIPFAEVFLPVCKALVTEALPWQSLGIVLLHVAPFMHERAAAFVFQVPTCSQGIAVHWEYPKEPLHAILRLAFLNVLALCSYRKGWVQPWLTEFGQQSMETYINPKLCPQPASAQVLQHLWGALINPVQLKTLKIIRRWGTHHSKGLALFIVADFGCPEIRTLKVKRFESLVSSATVLSLAYSFFLSSSPAGEPWVRTGESFTALL